MPNVAGLDRLKSQLLVTGLQQKDNALYQVINQLIEFMRQTINETQSSLDNVPGGSGTLPTESFVTVNNELTPLPFSRRIVAGDGITINNDGKRLIINSPVLIGSPGEDGEPGIIGPPGIQGLRGLTGANGGVGPTILEAPYNFEEFVPIADLGTVVNQVSFAYTPLWTAASVNPVLGNGTLTGSFIRVGKVIFYQVNLAIGSTTTTGTGAWFFSVPSNINYLSASVCELIDTGVAAYIGFAAQAFAASVQIYFSSPIANVSNSQPFAWGNGDILRIRGIYVES